MDSPFPQDKTVSVTALWNEYARAWEEHALNPNFATSNAMTVSYARFCATFDPESACENIKRLHARLDRAR